MPPTVVPRYEAGSLRPTRSVHQHALHVGPVGQHLLHLCPGLDAFDVAILAWLWVAHARATGRFAHQGCPQAGSLGLPQTLLPQCYRFVSVDAGRHAPSRLLASRPV